MNLRWKIAIIIFIILATIGDIRDCKRAYGEEDIDWDKLIPAIATVESNNNPNAVGKNGEIGILQISPIVLEEFNNFVENLDGNRGIYWLGVGDIDLLHTSNKAHYGWGAKDKRGWYLRIPQKEGGMWLNLYYCPLENEKLLEPKINTFIGTWYLRRLKEHYIPPDKFSVELLCACYNAGPTKMRKLGWNWKKAPKSTLRYIKKIMRSYKQ